jgi:hypothetical protein
MESSWLKISLILVLIVFLTTSFVPVSNLNNRFSSTNSLYKNAKPIYQSSSSDPSVHLYVNGNGYVIFSANYTVCCISFNYDNDKTQNFSSNDVPSGTIFHLVSSANSGYVFQKWTGSVNSTSNSINITVNQNIDEEAIYQKILTFSANFTENGLPTGNTWYVNITGLKSSGPIIQTSYNVSLPNGTYTFSVATTNRDYAANSYSNSFTVSGSPVSIPEIKFSIETYTLTFTESGLPAGTWYINLSNGDQGNSAAGSPLTFSLPNDTYSYTIATSNEIYHPSSYNGTVNMVGNTSVSIIFVETTYIVHFSETGLPSGQSWSINITESNDTIYCSGVISSATYSFALANGSYSFSVASANKIYAPSYFSVFTVNGSSLTIPVTFTEILYNLTIQESSLPTGTEWNLTFDGTIYQLTNASYIFSVPNGTYSFFAASHDYKDVSGTITVNGSSFTYTINMELQLYEVTFNETGLPSGMFWYVNISGMASSGPISSGSNYTVNLTNGTYSYSISTSNTTYAPVSSLNSIIVNGSSLKVVANITEVTYNVVFSESGLPSGLTWYVNLSNGMDSGPITSASYSFLLPNGTYTYTIASENKIYSPTPISSAINVNGLALSEIIQFNEVTYTVTFQETGLPSGTTWYVNLSNGMDSGPITGSSYIFSLTNGSYSYKISSSNKVYAPFPILGTFTVDGSSQIEKISFSLVKYTVTFNETGLPSGVSWYVNITETNGTIYKSGAISTSSYSFSLTNGSYSFSVASANKIYAPSYVSAFTVNGSSLTIPVTFTEILYHLTIQESGLPAGTEWNLTFDGTIYQLTNASYIFSVPNGTYSFFATSHDYKDVSGTITVNGSSFIYTINMELQLYEVTFNESGLPSGTTWYVNLSNGLDSGPITGSSYSFSLTNRSYSYTIETTNRVYSPTPSSGSFTVNGSSISKSIAFSAVTYVVTFTETGLSSGVTWYVNGSGLSGFESSQTSLSFNLSNGTYSFTVSNLSSYYTTITHFTVVVSGKNVTENIYYDHWAYITGSITPTNSTLTINGKSVSLNSSGSFNISVPNGTYHVVISSSGYTSYYDNFTLNPGNDKNLTISLKHVSQPATVTSVDLYVITGAVIAVAAIAVAVVSIRRRK